MKGAPSGKSATAPSAGTSAIGDYSPGGNQIYTSPNFGSSLMSMNGGMGASDYMGSNTDYANSFMSQPTGMARGGMTKDFRTGGKVQAGSTKQKAVKGGNSYANDKIPALLSEGEVVIPRSVMQSADPIRSSADFVAKVIAKRRFGK